MAKTVLLECDHCGTTKDVSSLDGQRSDGKNIDVDLCRKCWAVVVKDYRMRVSDRQSRRSFKVIEPEDIPRT